MSSPLGSGGCRLGNGRNSLKDSLIYSLNQPPLAEPSWQSPSSQADPAREPHYSQVLTRAPATYRYTQPIVCRLNIRPSRPR